MASEFDSAVAYALERVGCPALQLKPEQKASRSIKGLYDEKEAFVWLPTGFGKSVCNATLPMCSTINKLGHIDSGIHRVVLVLSPIISVMIDHV